MGALHEGHLSLVRRARAECDVVVVSLFVNPSQFNDPADLARYPRREKHDTALAEEAGADLLFAPSAEEVYPQGFRTSVEVHGLTERLEGAARGVGHFRAVTTIVSKLFAMALPDVAYFGQKDAQQVLVIRRMVRDLNLPVEIETCPTVREDDGLAMSSRNDLLDGPGRERARALYEALVAASRLAAAGERSARAIEQAARASLAAREVHPEYVELVDPDTLAPLERLEQPGLLALAACIGPVRLIDSATVTPAPRGDLASSGEQLTVNADREVATLTA
jgi:pantoate--beta-alanine ligase